MDIRQIAEEKYPDLDLRPFADKDGFIRNESSYWKMQEKRTAQRVAWIDGVNWCVSQKLSTSESALPISDDVGRSEQLKAFADWLQSDTANLNYDFKDLVDDYLKSL